jgi:hypothetical protein
MKMISSKQKDVLKGFLKQANAHNKFLEEQLLWKKRYEEYNPNSVSNVSRSNEMEAYNEKNDYRGVKFYDVVKDKNGNEVIDEKNKWTHDGFQMLYPNGSTADSGKWKHDLYETIIKPKSKYSRSKQSKHRSRSSNTSESEYSSDTDSDKQKRKRRRKRLKHRSLSKEKNRQNSRKHSYSYSRESSVSTGKQFKNKKRQYHRKSSNSSKSSRHTTSSSNSRHSTNRSNSRSISRSNSRHSTSRSNSRNSTSRSNSRRSTSRSNSRINSSSNSDIRISNRSRSSSAKKSDRKISSRSSSRSSIRMETRSKFKNVKILNNYRSSSPSNDSVSNSPYQKPHISQLKETLNANLDNGKQKKYKIEIILKKKENVPDDNQNSARHESNSSVSEQTKSLRNSDLNEKRASRSSSPTVNKRNAIKIRSKQRSRDSSSSSSSSSESFSSSDQHRRSDNKRKKLKPKNQSSSSDSLLRGKFRKLSKRKKIKVLERLLAKEKRRR